MRIERIKDSEVRIDGLRRKYGSKRNGDDWNALTKLKIAKSSNEWVSIPRSARYVFVKCGVQMYIMTGKNISRLLSPLTASRYED